MANRTKTTFCESPLILRDFQYLPHGEDTILLDNQSLELMYGIQETMRTLEPEGIDDVRTLLIETIGEKGKIVWYKVGIRIYKDIHGLWIESYQGESFYFTNKDKWIEGESTKRHCCKHFLGRLWNYVSATVCKISHDPKSYTRYLEEHVPYQEREGSVVRSKILSLLPEAKVEVSGQQQILDLLKRKQVIPLSGYGRMTLRQYIEVWKIAYCAYCQSAQLEQENAEKVFRRSNQGYALSEYDLDSHEEFDRWNRNCSPYHCYDIVYVRVHLYPKRYPRTDHWYFELDFGLSTYGEAGFRIANALEKAGIPFVIGGAKEKRASLMGEDIVYFSPDSKDYQLPYPYDKDTAKRVEKAIRLINWKPFKEKYSVVKSNKLDC